MIKIIVALFATGCEIDVFLSVFQISRQEVHWNGSDLSVLCFQPDNLFSIKVH